MWFLTARSRPADEAGFTILEALVALMLVVSLLAAVGKLVATSSRGAHALADHVALVETARAIEAMPAQRDRVLAGSSGERAGYPWRVDVIPFVAPGLGPDLPSPWVPRMAVITVRSPQGRVFQIATVQLRLRPNK